MLPCTHTFSSYQVHVFSAERMQKRMVRITKCCTRGLSLLVVVEPTTFAPSASRHALAIPVVPCVCMCVYIYVCVYVCMYVYIPTQTHVHMHTHNCIGININAPGLLCGFSLSPSGHL
jgi:hypothetical protein